MAVSTETVIKVIDWLDGAYKLKQFAKVIRELLNERNDLEKEVKRLKKEINFQT